MKSQNAAGESYGFSLSLGPLIKTNKFYPTGLPLTTYGLKVIIHNYTFPPIYFETYLSISPGQETNIIVERTATSNAPKPYSDCIDLSNGFNSEIYNWMINNNKTYRQKDCMIYR